MPHIKKEEGKRKREGEKIWVKKGEKDINNSNTQLQRFFTPRKD